MPHFGEQVGRAGATCSMLTDYHIWQRYAKRCIYSLQLRSPLNGKHVNKDLVVPCFFHWSLGFHVRNFGCFRASCRLPSDLSWWNFRYSGGMAAQHRSCFPFGRSDIEVEFVWPSSAIILNLIGWVYHGLSTCARITGETSNTSYTNLYTLQQSECAVAALPG
jgi:hypothetical protein